MALSKEELQKLEAELPRGFKTRIANKLNVSRQHVSDVFNCISENLDVVNAAIDMRNERRAQIDSLKAELAK
jgi:hypothetical protein